MRRASSSSDALGSEYTNRSLGSRAIASRAMEPRRASDSASILVRWMAITDANSGGFVHGGAVMKLCDEAAGLAAIKHSGHRAVTAAMDRMTFMHPVYVGELLTCSACVNAVWRT